MAQQAFGRGVRSACAEPLLQAFVAFMGSRASSFPLCSQCCQLPAEGGDMVVVRGFGLGVSTWSLPPGRADMHDAEVEGGMAAALLLYAGTLRGRVARVRLFVPSPEVVGGRA